MILGENVPKDGFVNENFGDFGRWLTISKCGAKVWGGESLRWDVSRMYKSNTRIWEDNSFS